MDLNRDDVIYSVEQAHEVLKDEKIIAFDLETTGLNPWRNNIALMQFYGAKSKRPVLIRINDGVVPEGISSLFRMGKTFVGHNVTAFDNLFLETHNVPWEQSQWYDTLVGECIISTTGRRDVSKSLKESVRRRLGTKIDKNIEHGNWTRDELSIEQVEYAVGDVVSLIELMNEQVNRATEQGQLDALKMEMELSPVVTRMSANGLPLQPDFLNSWLDEQQALERDSLEWLNANLGKINYNSPKQLLTALQARGIHLKNTRAETLVEMVLYGGDNAVYAKKLLDYRAPAQRLKMYQASWQAMHIIDGWVHPRFWQAGTDTLRFSSSDPNLQQVPKDGRKIIGNVEGLTIVSADYSQIEVRIAAELANDDALRKVLQSDDVHRAVAASIYRIPAEQVTTEQRRHAKATTFLLLFGGNYDLLLQNARNSGSSMGEDEAYDIFKRFFESFQGLARMRAMAYGMRERRVVKITLPNGAKRVLVGQKNRPTVILNTSVQGSAAVGLKYALLACRDRGLTRYIGATVHDEIVAAVPDAEVEEFSNELNAAMVDGMHRAFPSMLVKVEVKNGRNWQA